MKKDFSKKQFFAIVAVLIVVKLLLVSCQMVYILPGSAPIDDDLYFKWAQSITQGNWLGEYNYLTLSKYPFFAVWLALLHTLKIPYLIGGQLLWIFVSLVTVSAFSPIVKKYKWKAILFASVLYNPVTVASYTLRVYRDSIFTPLCFLVFVGLAGYALRYKEDVKKSAAFIVFSSVALGLVYITREDGFWLIPFVITAIIITVCYILNQWNCPQKKTKILLTSLPFIATVACVLCISGLNYKYYNRFILSDFTSSEFKAAYGAMTRLPHKEWNPLVAVPKDVRQKLYKESELFASFEDYLEQGVLPIAYVNKQTGDYQSGSFYWALRHAAQMQGIYKDANTAKTFWESLDREINEIANRTPNALSTRKGTTPPIKVEYVPSVLQEVASTMLYILQWKDMKPYESWLSDVTTGKIQQWEDFLKEKSNYSAIEHTDIPYHSPVQNIAFKVMEVITFIYAALTAIGLLLFIIYIIKTIFNFGNVSATDQLLCFITGGMLLMSIFRIFIISFMEVSAFNIGIHSMYVGIVYPIIGFCGFIGWFNLLKKETYYN